jgi:hypothetical protein
MIQLIDTTNDRDDFTYSGKTATTLTGCSGVLAHNSGATIIPRGVRCMVIDAATNQLRFYGDLGAGVEEVTSIGDFSAVDGFSAAIVLGSLSSAGSALYGRSSSERGLIGASGSSAGVLGTTTTGQARRPREGSRSGTRSRKRRSTTTGRRTTASSCTQMRPMLDSLCRLGTRSCSTSLDPVRRSASRWLTGKLCCAHGDLMPSRPVSDQEPG